MVPLLLKSAIGGIATKQSCDDMRPADPYPTVATAEPSLLPSLSGSRLLTGSFSVSGYYHYRSSLGPI